MKQSFQFISGMFQRYLGFNRDMQVNLRRLLKGSGDGFSSNTDSQLIL